MSDPETSFDVFPDIEGGIAGVGIVLRGASIVESEEGELAPACKMTRPQAKALSDALLACLLALG